MAKRALCVGVNDYPIAGMDLKGCVNDALAWAGLLVDHYDFAKPDVDVVLDKDATHDVIMSKLKRLLAGAQKDDVLVFTNSSHGTYLADTDGDEETYDEALCPWDVKDNPLRDDELRVLLADIPTGVRVTVISDSCYSGTATRAMPVPLSKKRFLSPREIGHDVIDTRKAKPRRRRASGESQMRELLLSGCRDDQFSFDGMFDQPHGAMTWFALRAITDAKFRISYEKLHDRVVAGLAEAGFEQEPQLEGKSSAKRRQVFT
jgi:metacaspase-1